MFYRGILSIIAEFWVKKLRKSREYIHCFSTIREKGKILSPLTASQQSLMTETAQLLAETSQRLDDTANKVENLKKEVERLTVKLDGETKLKFSQQSS